jgi:hypothetical protein
MKTTVIVSVFIVLAGCCFQAQSKEPEVWWGDERTSGYEMEIISEGSTLPVYHRDRRSFVEGRVGERYEIRIHNRTDRRVEVLIAVDGRDAIDGHPASLSKRGYVIPAYSSIDVDGYRLSMHEVAAFRFTTVDRSYAAQTGTPWTVGVVSVAIFPEYRAHPPLRPLQPYETQGVKRSGLGSRYGVDSKLADREGNLGTEFAERRSSPVHETSFIRENWNNPAQRLTLRYDDSNGCPPPYQSWPEPIEPLPDDRFSNPPPGWEHFSSWY